MAKPKSTKSSRNSRSKEKNDDINFDEVIAETKIANATGFNWSTFGLVLALFVSLAVAQDLTVSRYTTDLIASLGVKISGSISRVVEKELIKHPLVDGEPINREQLPNSNPKSANVEKLSEGIFDLDSEYAPDIGLINEEDEIDLNSPIEDKVVENPTPETVRLMKTDHTWKGKIGEEALMTWFKENGGWISENLKLKKFPIGNGLQAFSSDEEYDGVVIRENDEVFRIPEILQLNPRAIISGWNKTSAEMMTLTKETVKNIVRSKFDQQDIIIALQLMIECAMGEESFWYPYLQMLPEYVPRMDYFSEEEMKLLQDPDLSEHSRASKASMEFVWQELHEKDSWTVLLKAATDNPDPKCLTYEKFHHFTAIVGSRAFILRNIKFISPVADMVNHMARQTSSIDYHNVEDVNMFDVGFQKYHKVINGEIVVRADRDFYSGVQYVEEYGTLENSLYITKFGFVPIDNPQHCAVVEVPTPTMEETKALLAQLKLENIKTMCLNRDGSFGLGDQRFGLAYFGVLGLENLPNQLVECQRAQGKFMTQYIDESCAVYPGAVEATLVMVKQIAEKVLASCETTLEEDVSLLERFEKGGIPYGMNPVHAINAIRFRLEEKKVLQDILSADLQSGGRLVK